MKWRVLWFAWMNMAVWGVCNTCEKFGVTFTKLKMQPVNAVLKTLKLFKKNLASWAAVQKEQGSLVQKVVFRFSYLFRRKIFSSKRGAFETGRTSLVIIIEETDILLIRECVFSYWFLLEFMKMLKHQYQLSGLLVVDYLCEWWDSQICRFTFKNQHLSLGFST